MKRNDLPVKDVSCDEDVIMNLSWENDQLHNVLCDLTNIIKCLKINFEDLCDAGLDFKFFQKTMNTAHQLLKEENRN